MKKMNSFLKKSRTPVIGAMLLASLLIVVAPPVSADSAYLYGYAYDGDGNSVNLVSVDISGSSGWGPTSATTINGNYYRLFVTTLVSGETLTYDFECANGFTGTETDTFPGAGNFQHDLTCQAGGEPDLEFGDAPDATYPSLLISDGARHSQTDTEILGFVSTVDSKDYESDANVPDLDLFDDGLLSMSIITSNPTQTVTFEVTDMMAPSDNLLVNILIDLNQDGDWNDAGEHVVQNQPIITTTGPTEEVLVTSQTFSTAGATVGVTWLRLTLTRSSITSGWDGTMSGFASVTPFAYGETEDYEIEILPEGTCDITTHVEPVDSGTVTLDPQGPYTAGQTVTVTANPNTGWVFDHWSGDLSGNTNPEVITMDCTNKDVTAHFAQEGTCSGTQVNSNVEISNPAPTVQYKFELPDEDDQKPGTQMTPNPVGQGDKELYKYVVACDDNGVGDIVNVHVVTNYPDGTLKEESDAVPITDSGEIDTILQEAVDAGLITAQDKIDILDQINNGLAGLWRETNTMHPCDPAGDYTVIATVTDTAGQTDDMTNTFELYSLIAMSATDVDYGTVSAGGSSTTATSTVTCLGNDPIMFEDQNPTGYDDPDPGDGITWSDMTDNGNTILDDQITTTWDPSMCITCGETADVPFTLQVPLGTPAGTYAGKICFVPTHCIS